MDIELSVVLELLLNLSLLVALSIISGFIDQRAPRETLRGKLLQGALFSSVAVVGMLHPFVLRPGVIFDGRSMLVALCALFFGPLSTAMTVVILCALRIGLGGGGMMMGVLVITASGAIGLAARSRFAIEERSPTTMHLLFLGVVVHVVMLLLMFTLPGDAAWQAIQRLGIPIMVMFPLATVLTGKILSDQLEARRVLTRLRESEARFRLFAELAPVGIVISNPEEKTLYVSPTFEKLFGYSIEDMPSVREWWTLAYPDEALREEAQREWAKMLESAGDDDGEPPPLEMPVTCKDGNLRHIEFRLGRTADLNVVIFTDITERKRAEKEQAQSLALLENLARLVPGVIYQYKLNPDGSSCFPWASIGIQMIYEITPEEVREDASPVFGRLHPEDGDRVSEQIYESARTLEHFQCEFRVVLPEQGLRWRWSQARPERTEDGGTLWHGIIIDVTERKLAELETERLEAQLQQAMKMEAIGRLAGGVAHDFNNLLTGIQGFAELIHESLSDSDPAKQDVEEIQKAADSAASLTAQLLAFSRKQIVSPEIIDINEAVAQSKKMLKRIIGEDIEFIFEPGEAVSKIRVDPGQVNQVFVNLAVNSRDAMPEGGKLTIRTSSEALEGMVCQTCGEPIAGEQVILEISDDGPGIPSETLEKIFEPFFTTKGQGKGTGLGLSTVHGIVHQNKGHINVDSTPGEGATFRIFLPAISEVKEGRLTKTAPANLRGGERILVVEDQDLVLKLAVRALSIQGYRVTEARGGEAALALCERAEQPFDLVLTDVVMPKMSGKELYQRLEESYPGMKVLFMSGYTEDTIAHHGVLDSGINFIQKPFRPQDLARMVRQVLDGEEVG